MTAAEVGSAVQQAARWLAAYLVGRGGQAPAREVTEAGLAAGHRQRTMKRAAVHLNVESTRTAFGGPASWTLPGQHADQQPGQRPAPDIAAASASKPAAEVTAPTKRRVISRPAQIGEAAELTEVGGPVEQGHWSASAWRSMDEL